MPLARYVCLLVNSSVQCEHSNLFINGCLFDDNYANNKGGGVHIGVGRVSVVDSLFFNNFAGSKNVESGENQYG